MWGLRLGWLFDFWVLLLVVAGIDEAGTFVNIGKINTFAVRTIMRMRKTALQLLVMLAVKCAFRKACA
jgi:hypothetical protein